MSKRQLLDEFHKHEAKHLVYVMGQMFEDYVKSNPFIKRNAQLHGLAHVLTYRLGSLYQLISETPVPEGVEIEETSESVESPQQAAGDEVERVGRVGSGDEEEIPY